MQRRGKAGGNGSIPLRFWCVKPFGMLLSLVSIHDPLLLLGHAQREAWLRQRRNSKKKKKASVKVQSGEEAGSEERPQRESGRREKMLGPLCYVASLRERKRFRSKRGRVRNGRRKKAVSPRDSHVHPSSPHPLARSRRAIPHCSLRERRRPEEADRQGQRRVSLPCTPATAVEGLARAFVRPTLKL